MFLIDSACPDSQKALFHKHQRDDFFARN